MLANITTVTYNRLELTRICLTSLLKLTKGGFTLNAVDNGSTDGTAEYLAKLAGAHGNMNILLLPRNMGVATAANLGWQNTRADFYIKLDNDIEILDPLWLDALLKVYSRNPQIGLLGYQLNAWPYENKLITLESGDQIISSGLCNGGCVAVSQKIHDEFGFWNEDYGKYGYEDLDYSDRILLKGYLAGYLPAGKPAVRHLGFEKQYMDQQMEDGKKSDITSKLSGEKLFVLNKFLFRKGIRNICVERKHLPQFSEKSIKFTINPRYRPILKIHGEYLDRMSYHSENNITSVDFSTE